MIGASFTALSLGLVACAPVESETASRMRTPPSLPRSSGPLFAPELAAIDPVAAEPQEIHQEAVAPEPAEPSPVVAKIVEQEAEMVDVSVVSDGVEEPDEADKAGNDMMLAELPDFNQEFPRLGEVPPRPQHDDADQMRQELIEQREEITAPVEPQPQPQPQPEEPVEVAPKMAPEPTFNLEPQTDFEPIPLAPQEIKTDNRADGAQAVDDNYFNDLLDELTQPANPEAAMHDPQDLVQQEAMVPVMTDETVEDEAVEDEIAGDETVGSVVNPVTVVVTDEVVTAPQAPEMAEVQPQQSDVKGTAIETDPDRIRTDDLMQKVAMPLPQDITAIQTAQDLAAMQSSRENPGQPALVLVETDPTQIRTDDLAEKVAMPLPKDMRQAVETDPARIGVGDLNPIMPMPMPSDLVASEPAQMAASEAMGTRAEDVMHEERQIEEQDGTQDVSVSSVSALAGTIYFDNGSAELSEADAVLIERIFDLQRQTGAKIRVVGHASSTNVYRDPIAAKASNMRMSLKRAKAVAARLEALGLDTDIVSVAGLSDAYQDGLRTDVDAEISGRRAEIYLDY